MGSCCPKEEELVSPSRSRLVNCSTVARIARLDSNVYSDIRDHYEFVRVIGYGQFGTVREARSFRASFVSSCKNLFAVKSIVKSKLQQEVSMLRKELEALQLVDHPNIVKLFDIFEDAKYLHIVMENCSGGDLFEHLMRRGKFTESAVGNILMKLLSAISHLHSLRISHRDLKPENFIYSSPDPDSEIKIVDFGMSSRFGCGPMKTMVGTPYYLAPEVLSGKYGKECDIWSLGIVAYFLLSGKQPFHSNDLKSLIRKIKVGKFELNGEFWDSVSDTAKDLIAQMITVSPSRRISARKALEHPWFDELRENSPRLVNPKIVEAIRTYKAPSKLWQESLKILVRYLNLDQITELGACFKELDRNMTGSITIVDIEQAMNSNGYMLAHSELKQLIQKLEYIGQGSMNYTQFILTAIDTKNLMNEDAIWFIFSYFDVVRDMQQRKGRINISDLKQALERAGCNIESSEFEEIVREFQLQPGESMDFERFKEILLCMLYLGFSEENSPVDIDTQVVKQFSKRFSVRKFTMRKTIELSNSPDDDN